MKKIATVAHRLKEYPYNIVSVVEKIFLNEKVLIFVLLAEQLAYIKREKNMQYCNKSKTEKQTEWLTNLNEQGYAVAICYGCDEASEKILKYLKLGEINE